MLSEEILSSNLFVKLPFSTSSFKFLSVILIIFCSIWLVDLLKKFGFSIILRLKSYYRDGEDAFLMAIDFTS